jgi:hypothetical protein
MKGNATKKNGSMILNCMETYFFDWVKKKDEA